MNSALKHSGSLGDYKTVVTFLAVQSCSSGYIVTLTPHPVLLGKRVADVAPPPAPPLPHLPPWPGQHVQVWVPFHLLFIFSHTRVSINLVYVGRGVFYEGVNGASFPGQHWFLTSRLCFETFAPC